MKHENDIDDLLNFYLVKDDILNVLSYDKEEQNKKSHDWVSWYSDFVEQINEYIKMWTLQEYVKRFRRWYFKWWSAWEQIMTWVHTAQSDVDWLVGILDKNNTELPPATMEKVTVIVESLWTIHKKLWEKTYSTSIKKINSLLDFHCRMIDNEYIYELGIDLTSIPWFEDDKIMTAEEIELSEKIREDIERMKQKLKDNSLDWFDDPNNILDNFGSLKDEYKNDEDLIDKDFWMENIHEWDPFYQSKPEDLLAEYGDNLKNQIQQIRVIINKAV